MSDRRLYSAKQDILSEPLLDVRNLKVEFKTYAGVSQAVNGVSYHVNHQEVVSVVGESGCGKSVSQLSALQLVKCPPGCISDGKIIFNGRNLLDYKASSKEMRDIRGSKISMIFQEPMTSLNPVYTIGYQMTELLKVHLGLSKKAAKDRALELLVKVGIPAVRDRIRDYPFQMSGGMRQRVMIAMAISCNPELIIADEPTTALDVTMQAQVMELLISLVREYGISMIIVTHNLGLVARYSDRTYVMYAGKVVESGTTRDILMNPGHPYTRGLLRSVPRLDSAKDKRLIPITGGPPSLMNIPETCGFYPRCQEALDKCREWKSPELAAVGENEHFAACFKCSAGEGGNHHEYEGDADSHR